MALSELQRKIGWGPLTTNTLFGNPGASCLRIAGSLTVAVGMPGVITPCHYDEQENFFGQVRIYDCLHPLFYLLFIYFCLQQS